jgi:hypothetical protein
MVLIAGEARAADGSSSAAQAAWRISDSACSYTEYMSAGGEGIRHDDHGQLRHDCCCPC